MSTEKEESVTIEAGTDIVLVIIAAALIYVCKDGIDIHTSCNDQNTTSSFNIRALHGGVGLSAGIITSVVFSSIGKHVKNAQMTTFMMSAMIAIAFLITGILIVRASPENQVFIGDAMIGVAAGFAIAQTMTYIVNTNHFEYQTSLRINIILISLMMVFYSSLTLNTYYSAKSSSKSEQCANVSILVPWILAVVGSMTVVAVIGLFVYDKTKKKEPESKKKEPEAIEMKTIPKA